GFSACGKVLLHPLVSEGDTAREDFIKCALFNYAIGNCDAHGKNFSLICTWRHGMSLAPFYDLVSTRVYPELVQKFAMAIGETFHVDKIAEHSWRQFAADLNIRVERLYSLMDEIGASLLPALEPLAEKHEKAYGTAAIYETLIRIVRDGVNQLTPRCC
ncbi:HipA domain-containing protein, partial [Desulfosarcina sp. OttesenSCG-928-B08]|nr:HipA domain-containing protein [Desulfosarcina sp. OttesenSCG-928-B08]